MFPKTFLAECFWTVEGHWSTFIKPTSTQGKHANSPSRCELTALSPSSQCCPTVKYIHVGHTMFNKVWHYSKDICVCIVLLGLNCTLIHSHILIFSMLFCDRTHFLTLFSVCVCLCVCLSVCAAAFCAEVEERLVNHLLSPERYNKLIRPAVNNTQQVTIYIQVSLAQLINVVRAHVHALWILHLCVLIIKAYSTNENDSRAQVLEDLKYCPVIESFDFISMKNSKLLVPSI